MTLTITHSIRQILRARPRAVEILERQSGYAIRTGASSRRIFSSII